MRVPMKPMMIAAQGFTLLQQPVMETKPTKSELQI
jgi:hypothetical protein